VSSEVPPTAPADEGDVEDEEQVKDEVDLAEK
jgi:hypothetical protein